MEAPTVRKSSSAPAAFLEKLFDILEDVGLESYISWQPDGQSFLIKDVNSVSEQILPLYFKHNNIQSFVRQLNMYSFTKTRHDSNYREFRQPQFQRGRRDLLSRIKRKTQGSTEKNATLKRKVLHIENESDGKCLTSSNDEESEDKQSTDSGDDDTTEEISSSSSCSSDSEACSCDSSRYHYLRCRNFTVKIAIETSVLKFENINCTYRNKELEEIKHSMLNLESQIWSLKEKQDALSANYTALREKIEKYQIHPCVGPQLSSLHKVSDKSHWNIPHNPLPVAEPGSRIVKLISFDSQRQFKGPSDPRRIFSNARGDQSKWVETEIPSIPCEENKCMDQERNRRKYNPIIKSESSRPGSEGQGLAAIADAVSFLSAKPHQQPSPTTSRSSLADLLLLLENVQYPAHSVSQLKSQ